MRIKRFKLLASQHIEADRSQPKNEMGRYRTRVFKAGELIDSDRDLAALFENKFEFQGEFDVPEKTTVVEPPRAPAKRGQQE